MINQDLQIKQILEQSKTIAILGLSPSEDKPSHKVAKYLLEKGYRIIPIYPKGGEILGMKVYRSLQQVFCDESIRQSGGVDILDIFRKSEALLGDNSRDFRVRKQAKMRLGTAWDSKERGKRGIRSKRDNVF